MNNSYLLLLDSPFEASTRLGKFNIVFFMIRWFVEYVHGLECLVDTVNMQDNSKSPKSTACHCVP